MAYPGPGPWPLPVSGSPAVRLGPLPHRSIQVGLSGEAADRYVDEWTVTITDVTDTVHRIHRLLQAGDEPAATALLPVEPPYPVSPHAVAALGTSPDEP